MLLELRKSRATNVERAFQIDIDHRPKPIRRQLLRGAKKVSRCAVHDDIDLAELLDRLRNRLFDFLRLSNVSSNGNRLSTVFINRLRGRYEVVHLAAHERHCRTRFRKRTRNSTRDPRPTASDKRHAPLQNPVIKD